MTPGSLRTVSDRIEPRPEPRPLDVPLNGDWEGEVGGSWAIRLRRREDYFLSDCVLHSPWGVFQKGGNWRTIS